MSPAGGLPDPLLSVVVRTYNHAPFVAQALESVLLQRAPFAFEAIVAEDCSADGTRAIVEQYARSHPSLIRTILPERNLGHGEIFRRALEAARGRFVAYLDGDDYWSCTAKLARQVELLESDRGCASCFHPVSLIYDGAGMPSGVITPRFAETRFGLEQVLMECFIPAPSMVFRREVAERLAPWAFDSAWIDWLIHVRAAQMGALAYLPEVMATYRVHDGGMFSALDRVSQLEEDLRFYARLRAELPGHHELLRSCIAHRHAQLAVEKLGVSYDSCVVLADPARRLRPYFNGRHARSLPRRQGSSVTELAAIREAVRDLPPAAGDYGPRIDPAAGEASCYLVVPQDAAQWLEGMPELRAYLSRHAEVVWESEWVSVYRLGPLFYRPPASRPDRPCRVDVEMRLPPRGERAGFLDLPRRDATVPAHAVAVAGWVLDRGAAAQRIDFEHAGDVLWRAPVARSRPDVAAAFADSAGERCAAGERCGEGERCDAGERCDESERCGFQTTFNAQELPGDGSVDLVAVFAGGERLPLARLAFAAGGDRSADGGQDGRR